MSESPETRMAIQEERTKVIMENLQQSRLDQNEMRQQLAEILKLLNNIENRISTLEENKETTSNMVTEFNQLKSEVAGAKRVIRMLWAVITGIAGIAVVFKTELIKFFTQ